MAVIVAFANDLMCHIYDKFTMFRLRTFSTGFYLLCHFINHFIFYLSFDHVNIDRYRIVSEIRQRTNYMFIIWRICEVQ